MENQTIEKLLLLVSMGSKENYSKIKGNSPVTTHEAATTEDRRIQKTHT